MLLNKKEVAVKIGVSYKTLRRWADAGKLPKPTETSGRMSYWDDSEIERYLRREEIQPDIQHGPTEAN